MPKSSYPELENNIAYMERMEEPMEVDQGGLVDVGMEQAREVAHKASIIKEEEGKELDQEKEVYRLRLLIMHWVTSLTR